MTTPELTKWLRENSSGDYRPAAEAADLIDRLVEVMRGAVACSEHQKDCICAWCEVERQNVEIRAATEPLMADCVSRLVRQSLTLDEFIFEQLKSLEDFESSWRKLHRKNEEIYPLEMFAGDWSEQLAFWREREDLILPNDKDHSPIGAVGASNTEPSSAAPIG